MQLICGGVGDLFEHLTCQDVVSFTGSASTALKLRQHPAVLANSVRFTAETDSLNCSILGPDAGPGVPEMDLFVREVVREMTAKAGQKCTAIRRALVPAAHAGAVLEALQAALGKIVVGDPRLESVRMGPVASLAQRREVLEQLGKLEREAQVICGGRGAAQPARRGRRARRLPRPDAAVLPRPGQRAGGARRGGLRAGVHGGALRHARGGHRAGAPRRRQSRGLGVLRRGCAGRAAGARPCARTTGASWP